MKLLLATDLSARSEQALHRSLAIARRISAELVILHVVDEHLPAAVRRMVVAATETDIRSSVARAAKPGEVPVEVWVVEGNPYKAILATAEEVACDLIVLGRHRIESSDAAFGGTTMGRVVRMGRRPMLVVAGGTEGSYRDVMVGVDFSVHSRQAARSAMVIAPDAAFTLVHAFDVPFSGFLPGDTSRCEIGGEHDEELGRFVEEEVGLCAADEKVSRRGIPEVHRVVRQGDVLGVLRQEINRLGPDLLAIGTHGRGGVARALLGSVAQDLLNQPPCDLLVVRHAGDEDR